VGTGTGPERSVPHPYQPLYDPAMKVPYKPSGNYVWQDVIAIPPSILDDDGNVVKDEHGKEQRGYVKIRHRIVDFPGSYVVHCHMFAREDRGMMQLVRLIAGETIIKHH
jgi:FtsP/CotA-like multicopper oxidase with cupredoxin domain